MDLEQLQENFPACLQLGSQLECREVKFWADSVTGSLFHEPDEEEDEDTLRIITAELDAGAKCHFSGKDWMRSWAEYSKRHLSIAQESTSTSKLGPTGRIEIQSYLLNLAPGPGGSSRLAGPELTGVDTSDELDEHPLNKDYFEKISKYWRQRHLLFSKYDAGIKMDQVGWFSATPELIAVHHADSCGGGVILDGFTGVGGNAVQFASRGTYSKVIAIDLDPEKIEYAKHNAEIYEVKDKIEFIQGDFFVHAPTFKADTVFLSPPWGGPDYKKTVEFDLAMLQPVSGQDLFNVAKEIAPRVVMFLPRNTKLDQLAKVALSANPPWSLVIERNVLNGHVKAITAYFKRPVVAKE